MANKAQAIPKGYHTVTPSLFVVGAAKAIEFYKKALGAEELMRFPGPDGAIMHAEIKIGDSIVMLADEMPEQGGRGPKSDPGASHGLWVDAVRLVPQPRPEPTVAAGVDAAAPPAVR